MKIPELTGIACVLQKVLLKDKDIIFAYLFGSFATGRIHPQSDVDVAVYLKEGIDFLDKKLGLIDLISGLTKKEWVDVVILNRANAFLVHSVLTTGKLLFSRDEGLRIEFEVKNVKEYLDYRYYLERHWKAMSRRIKEGGFGRSNSPGV